MNKNEKFICKSIIILEIAALFVFVLLKKNYSYNGYTFHLTNVNVSGVSAGDSLMSIYEISAGDYFVGEKVIRARDGSVEFRGKNIESSYQGIRIQMTLI